MCDSFLIVIVNITSDINSRFIYSFLMWPPSSRSNILLFYVYVYFYLHFCMILWFVLCSSVKLPQLGFKEERADPY